MKKYIIVGLITLFIINKSFAQTSTSKHETKANIVMAMYNSNKIEEIKIMQLADGFNRVYKDKWLTEVSNENGLLKLYKNEKNIHYWDLENAVLIQLERGSIVIRLGY